MKNRQRFSGQSMVEFALTFPLVLFLIIGFLDLGRAVFYYSSLTNAVREATRYAIVRKSEINAAFNNPTNNSFQDKVLEYAFGLTGVPDPIIRDDVVVTVEKVNNFFTTVSIQATYTYKPITPGIKELFGSTEGIDLIVNSKMHVAPGAK